MRRAPALGAVMLVVVMLAGAGCALGGGDPSAQYFPKTKPSAVPSAPVDSNLNLSAAPLTAALGPVSQPDLAVTPGVVASHDVGAICQESKHPTHPPIPTYWDTAIFNAYKIPLKDQGKYRLDYLVPLQLGGANVQANLWPITLRPVGFHEKERLNSRLRIVVCSGEMTLDQAQHDIVADWYTLFVKYGA